MGTDVATTERLTSSSCWIISFSGCHPNASPMMFNHLLIIYRVLGPQIPSRRRTSRTWNYHWVYHETWQGSKKKVPLEAKIKLRSVVKGIPMETSRTIDINLSPWWSLEDIPGNVEIIRRSLWVGVIDVGWSYWKKSLHKLPDFSPKMKTQTERKNCLVYSLLSMDKCTLEYINNSQCTMMVLECVQ